MEGIPALVLVATELDAMSKLRTMGTAGPVAVVFGNNSRTYVASNFKVSGVDPLCRLLGTNLVKMVDGPTTYTYEFAFSIGALKLAVLQGAYSARDLYFEDSREQR